MKFRSLIVAVAFAVSHSSVTTPAQVMTNSGPIGAANFASGRPYWLRLPNQGANIAFAAAAVGRLPGRNLKLGKQAAIAQSASAPPTPGVYKTEPYACIMVVPAKCPDDRSVVALVDRNFTMPVNKPELRFIPLRPTQP